MVNGNYIVYGDRPSSESEIVEDHVHIPPTEPTTKTKSKRKANRTANELQNSLSTAQLDNETDSIKFEKKVKEPQLLRYMSTTDEESYGVEQYETYDMKPAAEPPRRFAYIKKPRNPADGSTNYHYSRSSSSSPSGQLPTISEHGEQHGTYRPRAPPSPNNNHYIQSYDQKLDKYFAKPKHVKKFAAKGSHPDSLYRVPAPTGAGADKVMKVARVLRWPAALFTVCVALACFVYFLMPDHIGPETDKVNSTFWDETVVTSAHTHLGTEKTSMPDKISRATERNAHVTGGKTPEIDFYDPITETSSKSPSTRKLPAPPVFPAHITPEVQYGNEKVDVNNHRSSKYAESTNSVVGDSTLKPHITQKPEKPLEVYFGDGGFIPNISQTNTVNSKTNDENKLLIKVEEEVPVKNYKSVYRVLSAPDREQYRTYDTTPEVISAVHNQPNREVLTEDGIFTSGHSKVFGIGMEDAVTMQSTTPSSVYNTRVSPTLPTWREGDSTTKNPVNLYTDVPQCRSTRLPMCRGVLPYDLAAPAISINKIKILTLLPQIEYLASTNCSTRVRQFACALLEPECHPPPYPPRLPCHNLCRAIANNCDDEIPNELAGLFNCQLYPNIDCEAARSPCYPREMTCGDGTCISRDWICDGTSDCPGEEDESNCSKCGRNEFRCKSGLCIQKRWLCDGYVDCPDEEDENPHTCKSGFLVASGGQESRSLIPEPGEEPAGSAPALAVHRPYAERHRSDDLHVTGESDSKELLMTSESSSALRSNFSRRPSLSRLTPYSHATLHKSVLPPKSEDKTDMIETSSQKSQIEYKLKKNKYGKGNSDRKEDLNMDVLGIFDETDKTNADNQDKDNAETNAQPPVFPVQNVPKPTRLDKSMKKFERYINGADLLKKAAEEESKNKAELVEDSMEGSINVTTEKRAAVPVGDGIDYGTAHASPCPSGELRCVDGRCITLAQLCDGTIDCTDHADEDNCYT